jgi:transcriptional regulator with XRE-family HTH domain
MTAEQIRGEGLITRPGAALKALRLKKGWSLTEVSRRSGLPISSLSKFENDKMDLTLDKLLRVAVALETEMAHLFTAGGPRFGQPEHTGRRSIMRAGEGNVVESTNARYRYLAYEMINKQSIPMIMEVTARSIEEFGEFNQHPGEELLYVIEGELELYSSLYLPVNLKKGDSIYFDSTMGHAYVAVGPEPCRVLSVCVAPDPGLLKVIESKSAPPPKSQKPQPAVPATVGKRPNAHKGA